MSRTVEFRLEFNDMDERTAEACARAMGKTFDEFIAYWVQRWFKECLDGIRRDMLVKAMTGFARRKP